MPIPKIDPNVVHCTVGYFRHLAGTDLAACTFVVNDSNAPVAVCVPYDTFLEMQRCVDAAPPMPIVAAPSGFAPSYPRFDPSLGSRVPSATPPHESPLRSV